MFEYANYVEAGLWTAIACILACIALLGTSPCRTSLVIAAATFLAFGLSDVLEVRTGAWWRPWWLLAWKSACVITLVTLYARERRRRGNFTTAAQRTPSNE